MGKKCTPSPNACNLCQLQLLQFLGHQGRNVLTMIIRIILLIVMTFVVDTPPCLLMIQPPMVIWPSCPCPPLTLEKRSQFMTTICN